MPTSRLRKGSEEMETIHGYRLRQMRREDLRMVLGWRNSERVHSRMLTDHKITWEEHVAWFERHAEDTPPHALVFELDGRPLGYAGYTEFDEAHHSCSPGAYIGETEDVPMDAGLTLFFFCIDYAFQELAMERLETSVFADNRKARKIDEFLGYERLEGVDICYEKGGTKKKAYRYAMTKDAWQARRAEMLEILMG